MPKPSPTVFISYAHADKAQVDGIKRLLGEMKVRYVSDDSLAPGEEWDKQLTKSLAESDYFIACISPNYLSSEWANFELGMALGRESVTASKVVPLLLRPTSMPNVLKRHQLIDAGKGSNHTVRQQLTEALQLAS